MPWTPLRDSLSSKPEVLAGPMLRKVTETSVTVWLALRKAAKVTLMVQDSGGAEVMSGSRYTIAIGTDLHLVAVTATPPASGILQEGMIYSYNLVLKFNGLSKMLGAATNNAELAYAPYTLPTFCLPPSDLNSLRIIQGSCRIPHGNGKDTLPLLDDLIAQAASNPVARPHQLLLTGDQIYADDVSASMLVMLTDAADTLLGWEEVLPVPASHGGPLTPAQCSPFLRRPILEDIGFTSEDLDAHLMSLGEYLCMYLYVWSDVLWTADTIPSYADVLANVQTHATNDELNKWKVWVTTQKRSINAHIDNMKAFRGPLAKVRRALANIPSYMIFDDHEATDDWNMTRFICLGLYGNALGLRVMQNGVVAYALCQHWGNAPEQFEDAIPAPPGRSLLNLLDSGTADTYKTNSPYIRTRVAVHDDATLAAQPIYALFHDPGSLTYNYTVEGPSHQVIFTDTRTWRSFPNGSDEASELLPRDQIQQQIVNTPATGDRALLVVLSTNAPPVQPIRSAAHYHTLANTGAHYPDVYEAWELPWDASGHSYKSEPTDRLYKALSDKLPLVADRHYGRAMLLSGDVHTSFATRLLFKGTSRFEDPVTQPQAVTAVFAQLVASSLRKQTDKTEKFHRIGYRYSIPGTRWLVPKHMPEGYAAWYVPVGTQEVVGRMFYAAGTATGVVDLTLDRPTTVPLWTENVVIRSLRVPDFGYRLDYLLATNESPLDSSPDPIPPVPPGATPAERKQAADVFHKATGNYRVYNAGDTTKRQMIGVNNIGEITFDWGAGDNKKVHHTLRWWHPEKKHLMFTTYTVSLDPNDAAFREITPPPAP